MTRRIPVASSHRSLVPALVTLVACTRSAAPTEVPPGNPPPPRPPPTHTDSGVTPRPQVELVPPDHIPMPLGGAPVPVTPMPVAPPPAPAAPAPAAPSAQGAPSAIPMPSAAPAPAPVAAPTHPLLVGRAPGVYLVHDHPPGTPCRPVSQTEIDALRQRVRQR